MGAPKPSAHVVEMSSSAMISDVRLGGEQLRRERRRRACGTDPSVDIALNKYVTTGMKPSLQAAMTVGASTTRPA
jgi:hypothetical protein